MDTLFGDIIERLKIPEAGGDIYAVGKAEEEKNAFARKIGIKMRNEVLSAKRYHLSSDFTKNAALLAFNVDDPVKDLIEKARLPFESAWIEWPMQAKNEAIGLEMTDTTPEFVGVLLKRINGSPTHFTITPVDRGTRKSQIKGKFVDWSPVSIEVDLAEPLALDYKKENLAYFKSSLLSLPKGKDLPEGYTEDDFVYAYVRATLLGGRTELTWIDDSDNLINVADYATYCLTPYYGQIYYNSIGSEKIGENFRTTLLGVLANVIKQNAGLFRFVLSALALLNDKDYIKITSVAPGKTRPGSLMKPKLQPNYNFVAMTAPHSVFIRAKQGKSEEKHDRIRHEVSGTWVNYHHTGKEQCEHVFANMDDTANRKICMLCGRRKSWRREHERGNIELGFKPRQARLVLDH